MARPLKRGIDYFPLDVNFLQDMKIRKIMKACGNSSISVLVALLATIYRDEGYYAKWDSDAAFLVADIVGTSEGFVEEVVKKAVQVDFLDKYMFDNEKILTSSGIQIRYKTASYKKKSNDILDKYNLLDISVVKKRVSDDGNPVNDNGSTQTILNETKLNKTKDTRTKFNDEHLRLARLLDSLIRQNNPETRKRSKKTFESWADEIRKMEKLDKRELKKIENAIKWSQGNTFWSSNILSAYKLREHYDTMVSQRKLRQKQKAPVPDYLNKSDDELKEAGRRELSKEEKEALDQQVSNIKSQLKNRGE